MAVLDPQKLIPPKKQPTQQLVGINVKVIKATDLLKGTLAAKKAQLNKQKKIDENLKRGKGEEKLETPKEAKKAGIKLPIPGKSFLAKSKNFINMILLGWVATRLLKFLPEIVKILKPLASIAKFVIKVGGFILNGLIAFVDAGYKAYEWTRGKVEDKFGEEGAEKFDTFANDMNKFMNLALTVGMTAAAVGMAMGDQTGKGKGSTIKPKGKGLDSKGNFKKVRKVNIVDPNGSIRSKTKVERVLQKQGLDDGQIRAYNKARQGGANTSQALIQAKKVKAVKPKANWWQKITTGAADMGDTALARTKKFASNRWKNIQNIGKNIASRWDKATKNITESFNKLGKKVQEKIAKTILEPFLKFIEPVTKPLLGLKDTLMKQLLKIPGLENVLKKIGLASLGDAPKLAGKLGAKALPWIGGLFNLLFAYDRFAAGDSIGGIIETISGALDIAGMWPGSLALDAYMFARDMFPETIMGGEEALVGVIPGLTGIKSQLDGIIKKLPDLGELVTMMKGGEEAQKSLPNGSGITPVNVSDVQKNKNSTINGISTKASYETTSNNVIEVGGDSVGGDSNEQLVSTPSGSGSSVSIDVSDSGGDSSGEFFYKKGG